MSWMLFACSKAGAALDRRVSIAIAVVAAFWAHALPLLAHAEEATKTTSQAQELSFTSRKDNKDGSSLVTAGANMPFEWQTKVGVDVGLAPPSSPQLTPLGQLEAPPSQDGSSGAAWANLSIAASPVPLAWD